MRPPRILQTRRIGEDLMAWELILWLFAFAAVISLIGMTAYQLICLSDLEFDYINPYDSSSRINAVVIPEFAVQGVLCTSFLLTWHLFPFLIMVRPMMCSRMRAGFTLNIIDTPGLVEGGYVNEQALEIIKQYLLNKTIDVLLYVDRLDAYRVDSLDRQVIRAITDSFGKGIWQRALVVLTHGQLSPPDGLNYDDFVAKRSDALLKYIRLGARLRKQEPQESCLPVVLVENSGRCKTNDSGEKILPDGTPWIPNLVKEITAVISNGSKPIVVDQKLIDGPNPNNRGKFFIPLILAFQYFFVVKRIQGAIKHDISKESKPLWELRDMGLADRKF